MDASAAPAPPKGFRKAIPDGVKLRVVLRQDALCSACGERLGEPEGVQMDHVPALQLRGWDPVARDTIPAANDPGALFAKHKDCHAQKTTGRKGESDKNRIHGDVAEIARLRRLARSHDEYRSRLLSKGEANDNEEPEPKKKSRWPKRSFNRGRPRDQEPEGH